MAQAFVDRHAFRDQQGYGPAFVLDGGECVRAKVVFVRVVRNGDFHGHIPQVVRRPWRGLVRN